MSDNKRYCSQAEFGRLCGFTKHAGQQIKTRIDRKLLVYDPVTRTLDVENKINKQFMLSMRANNSSKLEPKEKKIEPDVQQHGVDENGALKLTFNPDGSIDVSKLIAYSLNDLKTIEDIRLKQANVRLKELEEKKLKGKFIDSDYAAESLLVFAQTFMRMTIDKFNAWAIDVGHRNKLPKSELARINGEMKSNVNSAYDEALEMAEQKMEQAKNNTINNLESEMNDSDLEDD